MKRYAPFTPVSEHTINYKTIYIHELTRANIKNKNCNGDVEPKSVKHTQS